MTRHVCRFVGHRWGAILSAAGHSWFRCRRCGCVSSDQELVRAA